MIDLKSNSTSEPLPRVYTAEWSYPIPVRVGPLVQETAKGEGGGGGDILELGASLVNRDARHSSDISHISAQIEKLRRQFVVSNVFWIGVIAAWFMVEWLIVW
jgi:hypothetical protein